MKFLICTTIALSLVTIGDTLAVVGARQALKPNVGMQTPAMTPAYTRAEHALAQLEKAPEWQEVVKALGSIGALTRSPAWREFIEAIASLETGMVAKLAGNRITKALADTGALVAAADVGAELMQTSALGQAALTARTRDIVHTQVKK